MPPATFDFQLVKDPTEIIGKLDVGNAPFEVMIVELLPDG
jgi:hypothetical protein